MTPLILKRAKASKYKNQRTAVEGITFDSKREAVRWSELRILEKAGLITGLRRQAPFLLAISVRFSDKKRATKPLLYIADFVYKDENEKEIVEDVKGFRTDVYKIKRHLMLAIRGIEVREV